MNKIQFNLHLLKKVMHKVIKLERMNTFEMEQQGIT